MSCVHFMSDVMIVSKRIVLARQVPSENDFGILMRYVFSMCDEHGLGHGLRLVRFRSTGVERERLEDSNEVCECDAR